MFKPMLQQRDLATQNAAVPQSVCLHLLINDQERKEEAIGGLCVWSICWDYTLCYRQMSVEYMYLMLSVIVLHLYVYLCAVALCMCLCLF